MEYFWVYMLHCSDGSYYVGHTDSIDKRIAEHNQQQPMCYTSSRLPVHVVFCQQVSSRDEALAVERKIKRWTRKKKEALAAGKWEQLKLLARKQFD